MGMCIYIIPPWRLAVSLPPCVDSGQSNFPIQTPLHSIFWLFFLPPCPLSFLPSLLLFFLSGFRASHSALLHCLLFILARRLAQAFRKALTNSHDAFPPFCSMSTRCLTPACLVWLHSQGTWQTELLWTQSNRKSMRKDFLCCRGVKQDKKVCLKPFLLGECISRIGVLVMPSKNAVLRDVAPWGP